MEFECSIVFIGVGIKFYAHITQEAMANIESCEKLYHLVNEPATIKWLESAKENAESLEELYNSFNTRLEAYRHIVQKVINDSNKYSSICVVMYGHPLVLNIPTKLTLDIITNQNLNINFEVLPGISADSVLYCDLNIDPGVGGMQSYEATEFLLYQKKIDNTAHLLLWQIGLIGAQGKVKSHDNKKGITLIQNYLMQFYPDEHIIYLYEASLYSHIKPIIKSIQLAELKNADISALMTLYVPPLAFAEKNKDISKMLV